MSAAISDTAALRAGAAAAYGQRQAVLAEGPETEQFLQGQLSQDITAMAPSDSLWSLLLQPQGKISAWLRVTRLGHESYLLDVDAGWADQVIARLERFKLRTKCDLSISPFESLTVLGASAHDVKIAGAEVEVHDSWAGLAAVVAFGGPELRANVAEVDAAVIEALRVEAGRPVMGRELDESTIPAAAGIVEASVSFTKGCYTGQELVARIDSRGNNVPTRLVGLVLEGELPPPGSEVIAEGAAVGTVTSSGHSGVLDAAVALAYVKRSVEVDSPVTVAGASAQVRSVPLVRT